MCTLCNVHWIPSNFASGTIPTNMECTFFCVFSTTIGCFFPLQYYVSTLLCHLATSLTSCGRSRAGNFLPGPGRRSPAVNSTHIKIASSPHLLNHHHHNFQLKDFQFRFESYNSLIKHKKRLHAPHKVNSVKLLELILS